MCGIYGGVVAPGRMMEASLLERMGDTLVHRGPDESVKAVDGRVGLGCRRLAGIAPGLAAQPSRNEAGDVSVVCDGEITNAAALRRELEEAGHCFRTRSNLEVLPHLYEDRGVDFVDAIDGPFALALWDGRVGRLVLARDHLGEKPLYCAVDGGAFFFASEAKALFATGRIERVPDWSNLAAYLRRGYVPAPASAFATIATLPPGSRLTLEGEGMRVERYWEVEPHVSGPALPLDLDSGASALRAHLERAVAAALVGDAPAGVFLSGGLDSTAVAVVARWMLGAGLRTFSLSFETPGFDDCGHAALAARTLGTRHHCLAITPTLFLEGLRDLVPLLDEPLADPALVPTYLLARRAQSEVKMVLVGDGGDELFAGDSRYLGNRLAHFYRCLPAAVRRPLTAIVPRLGAPRPNAPLRSRARRFIEAAEAPVATRHGAWTGCFSAEDLAVLATAKGPLRPLSEPETPQARSELDALLALDVSGYLPGNLLAKIDRATTAASLESRAPFLDRRLVEFACRLPAELRLRGLIGKRVLRRAMTGVVPAKIRRRVKAGVDVPLTAWIAGPLLPFVRGTLDRLDPRIFHRYTVRRLLDDHVERRRDNHRELWALVMLQLWAERSSLS